MQNAAMEAGHDWTRLDNKNAKVSSSSRCEPLSSEYGTYKTVNDRFKVKFFEKFQVVPFSLESRKVQVTSEAGVSVFVRSVERAHHGPLARL